ncbi:MAG: hypothetical protein RLZZ318_629 [Bacteroidota bacterium]
MKSNIINSILLGSSLFLANQSYAQITLLKGVRDNMMDEENKNIGLAKYDIDKVMNHAQTKDLCAAYAWKGIVYADIAMSQDSSIQALDVDHNSALVSAQSLLKFYGCSLEEQEKYDSKLAADVFIVNSISACWNVAVNASREKGQFKTIKEHMNMVENLIPYDKEERAKSNNISKESAIYAVWRAAYIDSLVSEEIPCLEKLMAIPTYMNATVYIRMAEIMSAQKQYDKALDYLEKGKEKIPLKSGDFLDMQINIEIERENMAALLTKFNEAISGNPDNAVYYFSRGVAYHKLKTDEVKAQDLAYKNTGKAPASKYSFKQGLNDYKKAIELDNGYFNALKNEAILFFDSANYIYKQRARVSTAEYEKYNSLSINLYKQSLERFETLRNSGALKDQELIDALKDMIMICNKIGDAQHKEAKLKYDTMLKAERKKQEAAGQ